MVRDYDDYDYSPRRGGRRSSPPPPSWYDDDEYVESKPAPRRSSGGGGAGWSAPSSSGSGGGPKGNPGWLVVCIVAFGLIMFSILFTTIIQYMQEPDDEDYDDYEDYRDAVDRYNDVVHYLSATANVFRSVGIVLLSFGLFLGGALNQKLPDMVRLGLFVAAGLTLGLYFMPGLRWEDLLTGMLFGY